MDIGIKNVTIKITKGVHPYPSNTGFLINKEYFNYITSIQYLVIINIDAFKLTPCGEGHFSKKKDPETHPTPKKRLIWTIK